MAHDLDRDLTLAREALDIGTQLRSGRRVDSRRREEEDTAYLRALAFASVYIAASLRPGTE